MIMAVVFTNVQRLARAEIDTRKYPEFNPAALAKFTNTVTDLHTVLFIIVMC
jgi:hypothetical protein